MILFCNISSYILQSASRNLPVSAILDLSVTFITPTVYPKEKKTKSWQHAQEDMGEQNKN
jgi:hypothetical protein